MGTAFPRVLPRNDPWEEGPAPPYQSATGSNLKSTVTSSSAAPPRTILFLDGTVLSNAVIDGSCMDLGWI